MITNDPYTDPELIEASYRAFNEILATEISLRTGFRPSSAVQLQLSTGNNAAGGANIGGYQGELQVLPLPESSPDGGVLLP